MSITSRDKERSTPLHWACCAGSDTASYYLQSWGVDVNAKDFLGYTPLHLAVRYSGRFPNTRAIKELLIKGADRDAIENTNGLKPIDLVDTLEDSDTKKELSTLLVKPTFLLPCCHFKQPMVKIERNNKTAALFLFLMLGTFIANMIFVFPCKCICNLTPSILTFASFCRHLRRWLVPYPVHNLYRSDDFLWFDRQNKSRVYERQIKYSLRALGREIRS